MMTRDSTLAPGDKSERRVLVTGAGGFIGHHLVARLRREGYWVRGVDLKYPDYTPSAANEFRLLDLRRWPDCLEATAAVDEVYGLAADLGGSGFLAAHDAELLHNNVLISVHTIEAARRNGVSRYLYTSSARVQPTLRQRRANARSLNEADGDPWHPQSAAGREELLTERLCEHYRRDYGYETRVARLHDIFGPLEAFDGGREGAPAALCRRIAIAKLAGNPEVEVWGDGDQPRSFCYVDDCVEGIYRLMRSDHRAPLDLGQERLVSINALADMIAHIAGVRIVKIHVPGPREGRGRIAENSRVRELLGWSPSVSLEDGLASTYAWIESEVRRALIGRASVRQRPHRDAAGIADGREDARAAGALADVLSPDTAGSPAAFVGATTSYASA